MAPEVFADARPPANGLDPSRDNKSLQFKTYSLVIIGYWKVSSFFGLLFGCLEPFMSLIYSISH